MMVLNMRTGAISPRSILESPYEEENESYRCDKRRVLFESSATIINLRHRLVCGEVVRWLRRRSSPSLSELSIGPVFENSQTLLSAVSALPSSVTHLDLDLRNELHQLPEVMPILCSKTHVRTLSLRFFGDSGAMELANWIHMNPMLERLDLRGNRIGSQGARAIVDALVNCNHGLKYLNLSCNCILDCAMIGKLLIFTELESLDMSFNWIGDEEVSQVAKALERNTSLRELNVFGCQRITSYGLWLLLACIRDYNTSLRELHAPEWNGRASKVKRQINYWLKLNRTGRYLLKEKDGVAPGLWTLALEKAKFQPDSLFHFLRQGGVYGR
eukprot:scaffold12678_cov116-Cylindrotheca_fusiformis.AAC.1